MPDRRPIVTVPDDNRIKYVPSRRAPDSPHFPATFQANRSSFNLAKTSELRFSSPGLTSPPGKAEMYLYRPAGNFNWPKQKRNKIKDVLSKGLQEYPNLREKSQYSNVGQPLKPRRTKPAIVEQSRPFRICS